MDRPQSPSAASDASSDLDTFPPAQAQALSRPSSSSERSRSSLDDLREAVTAGPVSPELMEHAQEKHQAKLWVPTWVIVGTWIGLSTSVVLYNREIMMGSAHFAYPITLTTLHLIFQTTATRLAHRFTTLISGPQPSEYTALPLSAQADGDDDDHDSAGEKAAPGGKEGRMRWKAESVEMDWKTWRKGIVPPAVLFSAGLVLSNWAYLYLSTAYIHMLKASAPVAILLAAFIFRTKEFSWKLLGIVFLLSLGVGVASYGEANLNYIGFTIQLVSVAVEAVRVTLIQILLAGNDMSPMKSLYFFAPICLAINAALIIPVEGLAALAAIPKLGLFTILSNCLLTLALNLSSVYLISISSMVLSLSKVVKDVMLVAGSSLLLGDRLSWLQLVGYGWATVFLFVYKANA